MTNLMAAEPRSESGPCAAAVATDAKVARPRSLPEQPLVKIRPSRKWIPLNLREVWAHRELFAILVIRDVTIRYKQTILGIAWAIVQPLMMAAVYTVVFGRFGGIPSDGVAYPLFAFAGLLPWTFLANAVQASGNSLINNAHLITKVYFPRILIPAASVGMGLVDFAIAGTVLAGLMLYYHVGVTWNLLMFPLLILLTAALALGIGLWAAALNIRYRDVRHLLPFFIQVWMFLSPIIYPLSLVPQRWRWLAAFNPLYGIIENIRVSLYSLPRGFDWYLLGCSVAITLATLVSAAFVFRRVETSVADVI
jgi:lipopolysaccharide transport system permease protein